jgi:epoxyqueuosine reductase
MTPETLSNNIKAWAAEIGFDACGVAAATPIDPENRLGEWLARGYHADMTWIASSKQVRQDIAAKLAGVRSVVVVARNYYVPAPPKPEGSARAARYAWGRDYHRILRKPLQKLARRIQQTVEGSTCWCSIDSGPALERAWAAKAGLGWIGKNSLVLRQDIGSWFFLGVIATTAEAAPDKPMADHCGACRACIDACPTNAIVEGRMVDSNRCISYHTIENRGDRPAELSTQFDGWVFGCDICQEVCPWNRKPVVTDEPDFLPREGHAFPDPDALLAMDEGAFRAEYAGTPFMRARYEGMRRNARIALANQQRPVKDR